MAGNSLLISYNLSGQHEVSQFLSDKFRRGHAVLGDCVEAEEAMGQSRQDVNFHLRRKKMA